MKKKELISIIHNLPDVEFLDDVADYVVASIAKYSTIYDIEVGATYYYTDGIKIYTSIWEGTSLDLSRRTLGQAHLTFTSALVYLDYLATLSSIHQWIATYDPYTYHEPARTITLCYDDYLDIVMPTPIPTIPGVPMFSSVNKAIECIEAIDNWEGWILENKKEVIGKEVKKEVVEEGKKEEKESRGVFKKDLSNIF